MGINSSFKGFTLIELLTVIFIIGVLAAFTIPVLKSFSRRAKISVATAEMHSIETALESYKSQYGFYPPSGSGGISDALFNDLYYELSGVTNMMENSKNCYRTLDGSPVVEISFFTNLFKIGGAINCYKSSDENDQPARTFVKSLRPSEIGSLPITNNFGGYVVNFLVSSVGGPDAAYQPMGAPGLNPFRYVYPGLENNVSGGYDLWIQLTINGKTNLICNWTRQNLINSQLP